MLVWKLIWQEEGNVWIPFMATLLFLIEVNTCSSLSSVAMFWTSLRWNSSNSTGTSPAYINTNYQQYILCPNKNLPSQKKISFKIDSWRGEKNTLNTSFTAVISSGPTPSPGIIVTLKVASARVGGPSGPQRPADTLNCREASCCHRGPPNPCGPQMW